MRYKRYSCFLLVLIIAALLLLFNNCSEKIEEKIIQRKMTISDIREIPQNREHFISRPLKMICYSGKIYILDMRFFSVLVFTENGFSHSIGRPGQGPGEISLPISFDIFKDKLYVLNVPNRIEVFDLNGNYTKTIKIDVKKAYIPSFGDFSVYNDELYVTLCIGRIKIQRYGLDGSYIDDFISSSSNFNPKKPILSNPYNIYILPDEKKLILFNQFNGDIEVYGLFNKKLIRKTQRYDPIISDRALNIKSNMNNSMAITNELEVKSFIQLRSVMDKDKISLLIIPSQISLKKEFKRNLVYDYKIIGNFMEKNTLRFMNSKNINIRLCHPVQDQLIILDDELNLYIGDLK